MSSTSAKKNEKMQTINDDAIAFINSLKTFILWCENALKEIDVAKQYLIKIDGRYVEAVDVSPGQNDDEDDLKLNGITVALRFNKNLAHRAKYYLDQHYGNTPEIVNLHRELTELIKRKYELISRVEKS